MTQDNTSMTSTPPSTSPKATDGVERTNGRSAAEREAPTMAPPVDVVEDAGGITLYADLPGVPKDGLDVRVDAETLTIEGEVGLSMPTGISASHAEVQLTRYRRTFTLSKELDAEKVDAEFQNGVLRLRIPKSQDAQPRRIAVAVR